MAEGVTSAKGLPSIPAARRALFTTFAVGQRSTGLPARKSHSKSQRGQTSGDTQLRQATVEAGQVPSEPSPPRPATPGRGLEVKGSPVQIRRPDWSSLIFEHRNRNRERPRGAQRAPISQ